MFPKEYIKKWVKIKKSFFGGTFSGNSLSCYVGMKTSEYIIKNKEKIFKIRKGFISLSKPNE